MQHNSGPTVCPGSQEQPGLMDNSLTHRPPTNPPQQSRPNVVDIDEPEPECEIRQQTEHKEPTSQPANGHPVPTQQQEDAPKPANYSDNVQKLIVMGYDRQRAENALMAADFDLQLAIRKLHGQ